MKKRNYFKTVAAALFALLPAAVSANPAPAKQRVEQEFRRIETVITRHVYDDVLPLPELERMNMTLYEFMQDNPGVVRILRANAGGYTVNDVSSESPRSAPSRSIGNQKWFQSITQNRKPHYSMDADSLTNEITLFYAWPLMAGSDGSRFSGAFAAMIDLTAQTALIEDAAPFQLAFQGRAFFQHEWDDADYNEAPLDIRGLSGVTIRTPRPVATRLDPRPQRTAQPEERAQESKRPAQDGGYDPVAAILGGDGGQKSRAGGGAMDIFFKFINIAILLLLALVAFVLLKDRVSVNFKTGPAKQDSGQIIVRSMPAAIAGTAAPPPAPAPIAPTPPIPISMPAPQAEKPTETIDVLEDVAVPVTITETAVKVVEVGKVADGDLYRVNNTADKNKKGETEKSKDKDHEQIMSKMLKLIKKEFDIMDEKIEMLVQRIVEMEKKQSQSQNRSQNQDINQNSNQSQGQSQAIKSKDKVKK